MIKTIGLYKKCEFCKSVDVYITPSRIKTNKRFCSISCNAKYKVSIGVHPTKGKKHSEETKRKMSESAKGIIGAEARWKNHVKKPRERAHIERDSVKTRLEKKRFRNQRYKANKRNAEGSHTFREWSLLKAHFRYMCLCCKRVEPEIQLSEDHIIPLSRGGTDYIENIQPLCISCNTRKHVDIINYKEKKEG